MMVAGFLRFGAYVKFIPYPVTVGFTAAIAVIIFASQIKDLFGLTLAGAEPGPLLDKSAALWAARGTVTSAAMMLAAGTVVVIQGLKRLRPGWPGMLIAVVGSAIPLAALSGAATGSDVLVYRIKGAFFFGAASTVGSVLDRIADRPRAFVLDFAEMPFLDSTAAYPVELLARKMTRKSGRLYLTATGAEIRRTLLSLGLREPKVGYAHGIDEAVAEARRHLS